MLRKITEGKITVTGAAVEKINEAKKKQNLPENCPMRIKLQGCGVYGYSFDFKFEPKIHENERDSIAELNDITIVADVITVAYLNDLEIDFDDSRGGFIFKYKMSQKPCGRYVY